MTAAARLPVGSAAIWLFLAAEIDTPAQRVFAQDFNGADAVDFVQRLRTQPSGQALAAIVAGAGTGGSRALRVAYVGTSHGSERIIGSFPLRQPGDDFTLSYDVRFERGFQFVEGGKLHGLAPFHPVTGGRPGQADGWSARVMWRHAGRAESYTYHQDQPERYGSSGRPARRFRFRTERFQAVSLHVRLNVPATARNGSVRLYVDGRLISREDGLRLRAVATPDSLISTFLFSTFHGGDDATWAPRTPEGGYATVYALFDNIAVDRGEHIRARAGAD